MNRALLSLVMGMGLAMLFGCPSHSQSTKHKTGTLAASQPAGTGANDGPNIVLVVADAKVALGQSTTVSLKNTGQQPYRFDFKGGSNGCALPIYRMKLVAPSGVAFTNTNEHSSRMCTKALVPPQTIVIPPGQTRELKLETGRTWFTVSKSMRVKPKRQALPPGEYKLWVTGGALKIASTISITPRSK